MGCCRLQRAVHAASSCLLQGYKVHDACVAVGQEIAALRPDVILLSTPHGVTDLERFMLYLGPTAEGRSDAYCLCPPCCDTVSVTLDGDVSKPHADMARAPLVLTTGCSGCDGPDHAPEGHKAGGYDVCLRRLWSSWSWPR